MLDKRVISALSKTEQILVARLKYDSGAKGFAYPTLSPSSGRASVILDGVHFTSDSA